MQFPSTTVNALPVPLVIVTLSCRIMTSAACPLVERQEAATPAAASRSPSFIGTPVKNGSVHVSPRRGRSRRPLRAKVRAIDFCYSRTWRGKMKLFRNAEAARDMVGLPRGIMWAPLMPEDEINVPSRYRNFWTSCGAPGPDARGMRRRLCLDQARRHRAGLTRRSIRLQSRCREERRPTTGGQRNRRCGGVAGRQASFDRASRRPNYGPTCLQLHAGQGLAAAILDR